MKLFEKPNSIEELTEKRDWMKLIPEQVKGHEVWDSPIPGAAVQMGGLHSEFCGLA